MKDKKLRELLGFKDKRKLITATGGLLAEDMKQLDNNVTALAKVLLGYKYQHETTEPAKYVKVRGKK